MNYNFLAEAYSRLESHLAEKVQEEYGVTGIYFFQDEAWWQRPEGTVKIGSVKLESKICAEQRVISLNFSPMIWWHEYKRYKVIAKNIIATGDTDNEKLLDVLESLSYGEITEEVAIDDMIDILSNGQYKLPLSNTKQLNLL